VFHENHRKDIKSETTLTRILYLESDAGLADQLKKHLERSCYLVDLACDGEEGLALLAGGGYAAVLVASQLPPLGGLEVVRKLAQSGAALPAILIAEPGQEKIAAAALRSGAADYLIRDAEMGYLELLPLVIGRALQRQLPVQENPPEHSGGCEERYRALVNLLPDGISVHCEGRFAFINPAGAQILGARSCAELLGQPVLEFVHPDFHQVFSERLGLLEGSRLQLPWMEEKFLRRDGAEVQVEVTALPLVFNGKAAFQTIFRDITARKAAESRLQRMANYDLLTALPSRSLFHDRLSQLMLHARRDAARFALLIIDLDRFKEVNGRLGDYFADLLLKEVALRITSCLKESDTVARMGGGEFAVILSGITARTEVASVAERVAGSIGQPFILQDRQCSLVASIGISLFPEDGDTEDMQLVKADTARYRCKKFGRSAFQFYSAEDADALHAGAQHAGTLGGMGAGAPAIPRLTRSAPYAATNQLSDDQEAQAC
jgi:diguanylate cyclase (GGDEF)-like protein/PAS domain S-box-containing protein